MKTTDRPNGNHLIILAVLCIIAPIVYFGLITIAAFTQSTTVELGMQCLALVVPLLGLVFGTIVAVKGKRARLLFWLALLGIFLNILPTVRIALQIPEAWKMSQAKRNAVVQEKNETGPQPESGRP